MIETIKSTHEWNKFVPEYRNRIIRMLEASLSVGRSPNEECERLTVGENSREAPTLRDAPMALNMESKAADIECKSKDDHARHPESLFSFSIPAPVTIISFKFSIRKEKFPRLPVCLWLAG